jgi:hypothetical protein
MDTRISFQQILSASDQENATKAGMRSATLKGQETVSVCIKLTQIETKSSKKAEYKVFSRRRADRRLRQVF